MIADVERIARELTAIAVNRDFGDLREDMIERLLMREFFGGPKVDRELRLVAAVAVMRHLTVGIEVLADDISGAPH